MNYKYIFSYIWLFNLFHVYAWNILLYPGSQINHQKYSLLCRELSHQLGDDHNVSVVNYNPFKKHHRNNDTILIGHSLGGTFALLDAKKDVENVKGVVLLYSHFNQRGKMPYFGIPMEDIPQPTLTILGTNDSYLPFAKSVDDLFYKTKRMHTNKHFIINKNYGHYTGLDDSKTNILARQISGFIQNMSCYDSINYEKEYTWYVDNILFPSAIDVSKSMNVIDALLEITDFPAWNCFHFMYFLTCKPIWYNYQFSSEKNYLLKTVNTPISTVLYFLNKELFTNIPEGHIVWKETILPTNHLSIFVWLTRQPKFIKDVNGKWKGEIIKLPINDSVVYYKIPSRLRSLGPMLRSTN